MASRGGTRITLASRGGTRMHYDQNSPHYNYSRCTVPMSRLLPQYEEVKELALALALASRNTNRIFGTTTTVTALISHAVNDKIRDFQHTNITTTTTALASREGTQITRNTVQYVYLYLY